MKYNEATKNRPEGGRILDAPQLYLNIRESMLLLKREDTWQKNDRNGITIFKTSNVSIVLVMLKSGASLFPQEVDALVTAQILEGSISFESTQGTRNLHASDIVVLHSNEPFNATAVEDTVLLLTVVEEKSS